MMCIEIINIYVKPEENRRKRLEEREFLLGEGCNR